MKLDNNLTLPDSWQDVTVDQFLQLRTINSELFDTALSYNLEQIAILTDTSIDDDCWQETDVDELMTIFDSMRWLNTEPHQKFKREVFEYQFKDLSELSLGEFIDLEHYFVTSVFENFLHICGILYRKTQTNNWGHKLLEPRGYDEIKRGEEFLELSITNFYGVINEFIQFKKTFAKVYENLLEDNSITEMPVSKDVEATFTEEDVKAEEEEKKIRRWNWEHIIYHLSGGDITKFDAITNLPLTLVFNQLAMRKDLQL